MEIGKHLITIFLVQYLLLLEMVQIQGLEKNNNGIKKSLSSLFICFGYESLIISPPYYYQSMATDQPLIT